MPSLSKATAVGEKRALEKEMKVRFSFPSYLLRIRERFLVRDVADSFAPFSVSQEIAGAPVVEGLRGGKKRGAAEGSGEEEVVKKKPARAFAAFLGDQSSDSD